MVSRRYEKGGPDRASRPLQKEKPRRPAGQKKIREDSAVLLCPVIELFTVKLNEFATPDRGKSQYILVRGKVCSPAVPARTAVIAPAKSN
ncbi:hypothetical protein A6M21_16740 [Desulfotomaculum copahuensis]|uniref:Uncharacterized protein n=1 Tax=Desulfotomaculum copahuensis TaxID=1838280 RepID=A0A1B7LIG0_9FIRM|nr:hypothetical protein A6M21_16740 [Desulfotomaculum copahuensis]